jgi:hypothetical protein
MTAKVGVVVRGTAKVTIYEILKTVHEDDSIYIPGGPPVGKLGQDLATDRDADRLLSGARCHNTFGHMFRVTTFGESHGIAIGCVVDGCPPLILLTNEWHPHRELP